MAIRSDTNKLDVSCVTSAILNEEKSIRPALVEPPAPHFQAHVAHPGPNPTLTPLPSTPSSSNSPRAYPPCRRRDPYAVCSFCRMNGHYEQTCFLRYTEKHPYYPNYRPPSANSPNSRSPATSDKQGGSVAANVVHPDSSTEIHSPETSPELKLVPKFEYNYSSTLAEVGNGPLDWLLDSGCSAHFTKWRSCYREFQLLKKPISVGTGGGKIQGWATGVVPLDVESGSCTLDNVIFTPTLHTNCNMLSVTLLDTQGYSCSFADGRAFLTRRSDNVLWPTGTRRSNNLYFLDLIPTPSSFIILAASLQADTQILDTWHRRLGHLSERNIHRLQTMFDGIKIGSPPSCSLNADCVDCLHAGQHRQLSHAPSRGTSHKLELVHIDTCGPMHASSLTGKFYFIVFVDDLTRMI